MEKDESAGNAKTTEPQAVAVKTKNLYNRMEWAGHSEM